MLRFNVEPIDSALDCAVTPLGVAITIGPALAAVVDPPPQPTMIVLITAMPASPHRHGFASDAAFHGRRAMRADFSDKIRVNIGSITEGVLLLSAQSGIALRLSVCELRTCRQIVHRQGHLGENLLRGSLCGFIGLREFLREREVSVRCFDE